MEDNLHQGHRSRLREASYKNEFKNMEEHQLLELLLSYVIPRRDTNPIAHNLIKEFGNFAGVLDARREDLEKVNGIGPKTANFLVSLKHFFYAYNKGKVSVMQKLDSTEKVVNFFKTIITGKTVEEFHIVCVDSECRVKHHEVISSGTVNRTDVNIRKILETCFKMNVFNIIVCHNHPEGDAKPSFADDKLTKALMMALAFNKITLVDHIILSNKDYYSYFRSDVWETYKEEVFRTVGLNYTMQKPVAYNVEIKN